MELLAHMELCSSDVNKKNIISYFGNIGIGPECFKTSMQLQNKTNLGIIPSLNKVPSNVTARWSPKGTMNIMPRHTRIFFTF